MPMFHVTINYRVEADDEDAAVDKAQEEQEGFEDVEVWEVDAEGNAVE